MAIMAPTQGMDSFVIAGSSRSVHCLVGAPSISEPIIEGRQLVESWLFEPVDDHDLHRPAGVLEFQPELLLDGGVDVGGIGIDRWWDGPGHWKPERTRGAAGLGREREAEVVQAGQSGPVDHRTAANVGQYLNELRDREPAAGHDVRSPAQRA